MRKHIKQIMIIISILLLLMSLLIACNVDDQSSTGDTGGNASSDSVSSNSNSSNSTSDSNSSSGSNSSESSGADSVEVKPTSISVSLADESLFIVESHTILYVEVYPADATYTLTYNSSDESIALIANVNYVYTGKVGQATLTVSTDNGLSDSVIFEVKEFLSIDSNFEFPYVFADGSSSNYSRTYSILSIDYSWYYYTDTTSSNYLDYTGKIALSVAGGKLSDAQGDNNSTIDYINIKIYDKEGFLIDSKPLWYSGLLTGDKFKDETVYFYSLPISGAPYTYKFAL